MDIWANLTITIRQRVRQRIGFGMPAALPAEKGFDVAKIREFQIGDSLRSIHLHHYIRTGEIMVLERLPERGALVLFLVDLSLSTACGGVRFKREAALDLVRYMGKACITKSHVVQVIAFTEIVEAESNIIGSVDALDTFLEELSSLPLKRTATDPRDAIYRAGEIAERAEYPVDLVCFVSDFLFPARSHKDLAALQDSCDVIGLAIRDRIEAELPHFTGGIRVRDAETGETFFVSDGGVYDPLPALDAIGIDSCVLNTHEDEQAWFDVLTDFFAMRAERR